MKVKFIYKSKKFKHPEIAEAIKEVFAHVASTKWARYFPKKVKVLFFKNAFSHDNRSPGMMRVDCFGPKFFFAVDVLHAMHTLEPYIDVAINNGNVVYDHVHAAKLTAAHEIGHWLVLCSLAKYPQFGGHPMATHILMSDTYFRHSAESHINKRDIMNTQLSYRNVFAERCSDRFARFIVARMGGAGIENTKQDT